MKSDLKGLTKLARFLHRLPRKNFDQGVWTERGSSCGTKACVAGWAAHLFPSRFRRVLDFKDENTGRSYYEITNRRTLSLGAEAFGDAFRISYTDADDLCSIDAPHSTPKQAARAVMKMINRLSGKKYYEDL